MSCMRDVTNAKNVQSVLAPEARVLNEICISTGQSPPIISNGLVNSSWSILEEILTILYIGAGTLHVIGVVI